jgi:tripartite-type tricarboxylate transporter receptor subunit TctC
LPNVPTTLEAGFVNSDYMLWVGVFVPAKTPRDIINKLHAEMTKAIGAPAVKEKLAKLGVEPMNFTPEAFDAHVKKEISTYTAFVKVAGMKAN